MDYPAETPGRWRPEFESEPAEQDESRNPDPNPPRPNRRHYGPRKCRICLEEVQPTFDTSTNIADTFLRGNPKPRYVSEDPELGRLMSPCLCKGSQKYVHEGCLEAWRHASATHSQRNLWKCPTCGFQYRMGRLSVGKILGHWATNLALTLLVVALVTFALGFVGDKIIDFYLDPWGSMLSSGDQSHVQYYKTKEELMLEKAWKEIDATWSFHFVKGFLSLGVLGFVKAALASSPFYYFHLGGGRRRRGDGRDRYADISLAVVLIGAGTFIWVSCVVAALLQPRHNLRC